MKAINQNITRRTALAGAAAMIPATAIPAMALPSGTDPVFAAIENVEVAGRFFSDCLDICEAMDEESFKTGQEHPDRLRIEDEGGDRELGAIEALLKTVPTTLAGATAMVRHYIDHERGGEQYLTGFLFRNEATGDSESGCITMLRSLSAFLDAQQVRS